MKVILDLDGVLVNFVKGVHQTHNLPYDYGALPRPMKWDWFKHFGLTFDQVDSICNQSFWANLEWIHDGHDILRVITTYFDPEDIYLCTTPMPNSGSASGKVQWVNQHLPEYAQRLIITTAPKSLLAAPDRLLIDDKTESVHEFELAGGEAILVPRPWNGLYKYTNETPQFIERTLSHLRKNEVI